MQSVLRFSRTGQSRSLRSKRPNPTSARPATGSAFAGRASGSGLMLGGNGAEQRNLEKRLRELG